MSMSTYWLDTLEATCERYAIGEMSFNEAYRKLTGMGLCQDEAQEHLQIASEEPDDAI